MNIYYSGYDLIINKIRIKNVLDYDIGEDDTVYITCAESIKIFKEKVIFEFKGDEIKFYEDFILVRSGNNVYSFKDGKLTFLTTGEKIYCNLHGMFILSGDTLYRKETDSCKVFYPFCDFIVEILGENWAAYKNVKDLVSRNGIWLMIFKDNIILSNGYKPFILKNKIDIFCGYILNFDDQTITLGQGYPFSKIECEFYDIKGWNLYFYKNGIFYKKLGSLNPVETKQFVSFHPKANNPLSRKKVFFTALLALKKINIKIPTCLKKFIFGKF